MTSNRRFSLALDSLSELNLQSTPTDSIEGTMQTQPTTASSNASQTNEASRILAELGALPRGALFLGMAADGLPVLLNLYDPHPGPMLITGETGSGKTSFLRSIAHSVVVTQREQDVQFGVITNRIEEWNDIQQTKHLVEIFDSNQSSAQNFISSLASWAHSNRNTQQIVLLLVDDLESIAKSDFEALQNFRWLLLRGPARRVWPIITMSAERYGQVLAWIEIFRTRIFGRIENTRVAEALGGDKVSTLEELEAGKEFSLRENGNWLRFTIPSF
jgi:hypothetical protein